MSEIVNAVPSMPAPSHHSRAWARKLLERAGKTPRDLSLAWGVSRSSVSRWFDGQYFNELSLRYALAYCELTGITLDELALRLGLPPTPGAHVELAPVGDPPLPTIRITPSRQPGRWLFLAHVEVGAAALTDITRALDEAAADLRVRQSREATKAKLAGET